MIKATIKANEKKAREDKAEDHQREKRGERERAKEEERKRKERAKAFEAIAKLPRLAHEMRLAGANIDAQHVSFCIPSARSCRPPSPKAFCLSPAIHGNSPIRCQNLVPA
jgi:hypothetical protein